jgi:hypothetical protein
MQQNRTISMPPLDLRAEVGAVNDEKRTVNLIFATAKADVLRYDWETGKRFYERLSLDPKHVDMSRLASGTAPLLDSHSAYSLSNVIGVVETASLEAKRGVATVRFSKRAEVTPRWDDVRDGIIKNVSVGYRVQRFEDTGEARDGYPVMLATRWMPFEISMVPMGADAGARVRSSKDIETNPCVIERRMNELAAADVVRQLQLARAR